MAALGLAAGLPFTAALEAAADWSPQKTADEVRSVLRRARSSGAALALNAADGELGPLLRQASRAMASGAALGPTVSDYVSEQRRELAARRRAEVQRLPVRLLLPLSLLILPGFVVLTLGPALLTGLNRIRF